MQKFKKLLLIIICFATTDITAFAQPDSTGMPGDNFSLQGALEMFKQASSPEEFEKLEKYAVNKAKAEKFARDAKLKNQQLDYLPSNP